MLAAVLSAQIEVNVNVTSSSDVTTGAVLPVKIFSLITKICKCC
jgi:hypothetical protein